MVMKIKSITILMVSFLMMSCSMPSLYVKPVAVEEFTNSRVVDKNFDDTWSALIAYAGTSFFSIDLFEKSSGLMSLNFSYSNPDEFINGGYYRNEGIPLHDGSYISYLTKNYSTSFTGKMNIVVQAIDDNSTKISVNARYIFNVSGQFAESGTWSFDTSGSATRIISNEERKMIPTFKAEKTILDTLDEIMNK